MANRKRTDKVSQKQMVREAIGTNGWTASPLELKEAIQTKHGVELPNNVISNYKSVIKKESGMSGAVPTAGAGLNLGDLEAMRNLVKRLGAEQVKKLAEMFE
ncbi:MAG TPA: hypothetical protein VGE74_26590 [Gemmata sp.]